MPRAYRKIEGDEYQVVANATASATFDLLNRVHQTLLKSEGVSHGDAGPVICGAVGGLINFALQGAISDAELRGRLIKSIDECIPQVRMAQASGNHPGGTA